MRIAATNWVTVSWVATASSNTVESTHRRRRPRSTPVSAITSATLSNTRSGRSDPAIRLRQYTSVVGSNEPAVNDRPQATFHRMSYITASAVCRSDSAYSSLSTSTDPTRSAGNDGRPAPDPNRSAVNESSNSAPRCAAKNANTLPAGTRPPATASASHNSRSDRATPCTRGSSQTGHPPSGRRAVTSPGYSARS